MLIGLGNGVYREGASNFFVNRNRNKTWSQSTHAIYVLQENRLAKDGILKEH